MAETELAPKYAPVERGDDVGMLARRLIGDDDTLPDLTAAVPLMDALEAEGDRDTAFRLRNELANMVPLLIDGPETETDPRQRSRILNHIRNNLLGCLTPVLFDFNSLAIQLAAFVERCAKREAVESGKVELATVRVSVHEQARVGNRVQIDDERWGMIVSPRGADGKADVVPVDDETYGDEAGGMPAMNRSPMSSFARYALDGAAQRRRERKG